MPNLKKIVKEEIKKILSEQGWPQSFSDFLDSPSVMARSFNRKGYFPTTYDTRPKEAVPAGFTDEYGIEQPAGAPRVVPGEQLTRDLDFGTELWKRNVPGFYQSFNTGDQKQWRYKGPGQSAVGSEPGAKSVYPPQDMGGSDLLKNRFKSETEIKDRLSQYSTAPRYKRTYSDWGQITDPTAVPIQGDPRVTNIDANEEYRGLQSFRAPGQWGDWTDKWGDMLTSVGDVPREGLTQTHTDPRTGERRQNTLFAWRATEEDLKQAKEIWETSGEGARSGIHHLLANFSTPEAVEKIAHMLMLQRKARGYTGLQDQINLLNKEGFLPSPGFLKGGDIYKAPALWPDDLPGISDAFTGLGSGVASLKRSLGYHQPDPNIFQTRQLNNLAQALHNKDWDELSDAQQSRITQTTYSAPGLNPGYAGAPDYQLGALDAWLATDSARAVGGLAGLARYPALRSALVSDFRSMPAQARQLADLRRSPTLQAPFIAADKYGRWRRGGGHLPWWPLRTRIKYPQRDALGATPESLKGYEFIGRSPTGELIYQPPRTINRGNLLPGRQGEEILVKESKLNDIFEEELEKLLKEIEK